MTQSGLVDRSGDESVLNELDENALEAALTLVESAPGDAADHEVIVVTAGPPAAVDAVRKGLQFGATRGIHILDDAIAGSDVFGTAAVLAGAINYVAQSGPIDLVLTGMASLDGLTSMMPSLLAAKLDWAQVTLASELAIADGVINARRDLDHVIERVTAPLPAVVSVTDQSNEPRYPNFKAIMAARKKPIETLTLDQLPGVATDEVGAQGARTVVLSAAPRPERERGPVITDTGDAGAQLANWLVEQNLV